MSEKSKGSIGDTSPLFSSSISSASSKVVKNPLLSASVTGLTFDDFQDRPLLLPAAPPIITAQPLIEETKETEFKSQSAPDSDTFSEINLNATCEEDISTTEKLNPAENTNLITKDYSSESTDSILSQAASSFSQLPTVASSVLSTFSKVIKDYSPTSNSSNTRENSLDRETPKTETTIFENTANNNIESSLLPPATLSSALHQLGPFETQSSLELPKFYSPTDLPPPPPPSSSCLSTSAIPTGSNVSGQQNNYRLSAKKKTYAQIPGISTSVGNQTSQQFGQYPPVPPLSGVDFSQQSAFSSAQHLTEPSVIPQNKPEERKGLLSFASSFVPPVLQNLSNLVQSSSSNAPEGRSGEVTTVISTDLKPPESSSVSPLVPQFYNLSTQGASLPQQSSVNSGFLQQHTTPPPIFSSGLNQGPSPLLPPQGNSINSEINFFTLHSTENLTPLQSASGKKTTENLPSLSPTQFGVSTIVSTAPQTSVSPFQQNTVNFFTASPTTNFTSSVSPSATVTEQKSLPAGSLPFDANTLQSSTLKDNAIVSNTKLFTPSPKASFTESYPPPSSVTDQKPLPTTQSLAPPFVDGANIVSGVNLFTPPSTASSSGHLSHPASAIEHKLLPSNNSAPQFFSPQNYSGNNPILLPPTQSTTPSSVQTTGPPSKPPTNIGSNTFRLQKGTRLYKSPFAAGITPQITTPLTDHPSTLAQSNFYPPISNLPPTQSAVPQQFFNPAQQQSFSDTLNNQQQVPLLLKPNIFDSQQQVYQETKEDTNKNLTEKFLTPTAPPLPNPQDFTVSNSAVNQAAFEAKNFSAKIDITAKVEPTKEEIFEARTKQHINPFEPEQVSTPIPKLSPSLPSPISSGVVDLNENPLNLPPSSLSPVQSIGFESFGSPEAKTTESLKTSTLSQNNNFVPSEININQPKTFNLTNYFVSQENNNFVQQQQQPQQQQQYLLTRQTASPAIVSPNTETVTNYFPSNQEVINFASSYQSKPLAPAPTPQIPLILPDPSSFFDSFQNTDNTANNNSTLSNGSNNTNDTTDPTNSLRIQNFFNNPPQNISDSVSELNYKLVGCSVDNKRLKNFRVDNNFEESSGALSSISNTVEPPSSSCSEFSSEYSTQQQQQQQPQQNKFLTLSDLSKLSPDELPDEIIEQLKMADSNLENSLKPLSNEGYRPVKNHWFYNKNTADKKPNWMPFSQHDSDLLEQKYTSSGGQEVIVPVEGGRYDVNIKERQRNAVYWITEPTEVRRCSWFYKSVDSKYVPYEEEVAKKLEEEYRQASISGEWRRKVSLPSGENVTFHGPNVMVHFHQPQNTDSWGGPSTTPVRPRVVKRDVDDFEIEPGESSKVDHLLLMVHGIGSACDLKFRSVEEVDCGIYFEVDEFRSIATQLIQAHYKSSYDTGDVGRVEVLPVSWHSELHSKESGIDERLKSITLESIPKLRNFTNDTLVDILFYTSPVFCQSIINTVCTAMNSIYVKYCERNPDFKGGVSVAGHSLGSLILFDLLCHQQSVDDTEIQNSENPDQILQPIVSNTQSNHTEQISYSVGPAGTGQPYISYPQLIFQPKKFFALGSPIGMFVTIRGMDGLGLDFKLPTCPGFYNIFHPFDPVAYRIEALINPELSSVRPVLISHHKGRKRMHLELKETMTRVGADLKQKVVDTFKNTFDSVYYLTTRNKQSDSQEIQKEVNKVLNEQLKVGESNLRSRSTSMSSDLDNSEIDLPLGKLNNSRRIDYVLQEAPLEFFNEYLFALTSHVCYWESEDTILFIMKEIYSLLEINPDSQVPQQSMTIERPSPKNGSLLTLPNNFRS